MDGYLAGLAIENSLVLVSFDKCFKKNETGRTKFWVFTLRVEGKLKNLKIYILSRCLVNEIEVDMCEIDYFNFW